MMSVISYALNANIISVCSGRRYSRSCGIRCDRALPYSHLHNTSTSQASLLRRKPHRALLSSLVRRCQLFSTTTRLPRASWNRYVSLSYFSTPLRLGERSIAMSVFVRLCVSVRKLIFGTIRLIFGKVTNKNVIASCTFFVF